MYQLHLCAGQPPAALQCPGEDIIKVHSVRTGHSSAATAVGSSFVCPINTPPCEYLESTSNDIYRATSYHRYPRLYLEESSEHTLQCNGDTVTANYVSVDYSCVDRKWALHCFCIVCSTIKDNDELSMNYITSFHLFIFLLYIGIANVTY